MTTLHARVFAHADLQGTSGTARLTTEQLTLAYRADRPVVTGLDLSIPSGQVTAIIGANGSGKSTVLKALARLLRPVEGRVLLDGQDIHALATRDVARQLGLLPQGPVTPDGITVADLVRRGRMPHTSVFRQWSATDEHAVDHALAMTGMSRHADEQVDSLSGGQRQRAWLALTVAQDTPLLLLDEPTTFLDVAHEMAVFELLGRQAREGRAVLLVSHQLNLVARFADRLILLHEGRIAASGGVGDVMQASILEKVYGWPVVVTRDPAVGAPALVPLRRNAGNTSDNR